MIEGIPKISVLIICYKQEELIKRAINSLLSQKDFIYEICVSDDCSPDRTWEVLQEYDRQYPGLFKLHQNHPNVGIFENIEYTWTMPTGDIIYQLSGDDECGKGWFKTVIEFIQNNNINYKEELFCIYSDYQAIYPNGDSFIFKNKSIKSNMDALGLALRRMICNRSACYSINILKKFVRISEGKSYAVESAQDMQIQMIAQKNYYLDRVGNVYYARIGVCVGKKVDASPERLSSMEYVRIAMHRLGRSISNKDMWYMKFREATTSGNRPHYNKFQLLIIWVRAFYYKQYIRSSFVKRYIFALMRRMPHSSPISMSV